MEPQERADAGLWLRRAGKQLRDRGYIPRIFAGVVGLPLTYIKLFAADWAHEKHIPIDWLFHGAIGMLLLLGWQYGKKRSPGNTSN
jgi:hypothetical protein